MAFPRSHLILGFIVDFILHLKDSQQLLTFQSAILTFQVKNQRKLLLHIDTKILKNSKKDVEIEAKKRKREVFEAVLINLVHDDIPPAAFLPPEPNMIECRIVCSS